MSDYSHELPQDPFPEGFAEMIELDEENIIIGLDDENRLVNAQAEAARKLDAGESFSLWLSQQFPDRFSGENQLDAATAYELMVSFRKN